MSSISEENEDAKVSAPASPSKANHPPPSAAAAVILNSGKKEKNASSSSSTVFPVGPLGKRELRNALKNTVNPNQTIREFQQTHSLHTMISKAFHTNPIEETLDSDSVMAFLSHLNIPQYQIHKRITDTLIQEVCEEIRKTVLPTAAASSNLQQADPPDTTSSMEELALLDLLKSCWSYTTTLPELRPIVWSILKQLGASTPTPVLLALTEREEDGKLKHAELYKPLSLLLKQLCWEVDWEHRLPNDSHNTPEPEQFLTLAQETLLYKTLQADITDYLQNPLLCDMANHPFVSTVSERRLLTAQRRALNKSTATTTTAAAEGGNPKRWTTGKAISHLRHLLSSSSAPDNTTAASSSSTSYRPKLLYAILSTCMAQYSQSTIGGAGQLHCTLVADILLLSAGGPLPKAYNDVLALARALDDVVNEGNLSDAKLFQIQSTLKSIFQPDQGGDGTAASDGNTAAVLEKQETAADTPTNATKRQWNRWIASGLSAMKESDPQQLFLNPVTDKIAPGYSSIIKHPMSIRTMEDKLEQHLYPSVMEWEKDVTLMYKNCIQYNRGPSGVWFRNEANRQSKIFREEIFPPIRRLYQNEVAKRNFLGATAVGSPGGDAAYPSGGNKRSNESIGPEIVPLLPSMKKRKKEREEYIPSMPALASMLLSDPFVVRILLSRVLRELRRSVVPGQTIPCTHSVIPSILQLLHIIRWSKDICAMRGKKFFVPASGMEKDDEPTAYTSYTCLRVYIPLLLRLLLESEFDRRTAQGGDLYPAAQSSSVAKVPPFSLVVSPDEHQDANVAVTLIQGSLIHLCLPWNQTETSLASTFPKFASILQGLSENLLEDRLFFVGLREALLKHKTKLPRSTRDAIVAAWLSWLRGTDSAKAIVTPAHECLLLLFNAWFSLGNVLLPRDVMIRLCTNTVEVFGAELFRTHWKSDTAQAFAPIKKQYEHMLQQLPEAYANEWMEHHGIAHVEKVSDYSQIAT